jgi:hypothetical protein
MTGDFLQMTDQTVSGLPIGDGKFIFTNTWFETNAEKVWDNLFTKFKPGKVLEIGSYEGASICYLIGKLAQEFPIEIHCIDTWNGGLEHRHRGIDMAAVESRFCQNTKLAISRVSHEVSLVVHKGFSDYCLASLISHNHGNSFDLVYVDGSHQAPDVLADAVMAFRFLRVGISVNFMLFRHPSINCMCKK